MFRANINDIQEALHDEKCGGDEAEYCGEYPLDIPEGDDEDELHICADELEDAVAYGLCPNCLDEDADCGNCEAFNDLKATITKGLLEGN